MSVAGLPSHFYTRKGLLARAPSSIRGLVVLLDMMT